MKYHVRVFELDTKGETTMGQYVSPFGVTLDTYLETETSEGYHLERMVSLPDNLANMLLVVTTHAWTNDEPLDLPGAIR